MPHSKIESRAEFEAEYQELVNSIVQKYEENVEEDMNYIISLIEILIKQFPLETGRKTIVGCSFIQYALTGFLKNCIEAFINFTKMFEGFVVDQQTMEKMLERISDKLNSKLDKINYDKILELCTDYNKIYKDEFEQLLSSKRQ